MSALFLTPSSHWILSGVLDAVTGAGKFGSIHRRAQLGMVRAATCRVTVSDTQVRSTRSPRAVSASLLSRLRDVYTFAELYSSKADGRVRRSAVRRAWRFERVGRLACHPDRLARVHVSPCWRRSRFWRFCTRCMSRYFFMPVLGWRR